MRGGSELILVVEDEEVVRQLICTVLADLGYRVLCADCATTGLQMAHQENRPIDLLVTDIVMPDMHGPVLARELLGLQPNMKVLYVSGYSDSDISDQGVLDPSLEMLQKPFPQDSLARKVREILDATAEPRSPRR